jgi:hypothetical protein
MFRAALGLGIVAVLLLLVGCQMCCHPYDYSGPVYDGQGCRSYGPTSRAGSILSGTPQLTPSLDLAQRPAQGRTVSSRASLQNQVKGDVRPGDVPGSQRIVSVTDRVVEPSTTSEQPQLAAGSSTQSADPLPVNGWTARRSEPDAGRQQ